MLFDRQKQLLALLDALGGNVSALDFQKLLFLYCQELHGVPTYDFVPYKLGGFSFTSYADKRRLIEQGFLENMEGRWTLTQAGRNAASTTSSFHVRMSQFAQRYDKLRGEMLVAEIYRRYPYYAIRSEMLGVLAGDKAALAAIEKARPLRGKRGICTIGYEGLSLERYLNLLIQDGVTLLCDVRRNPLSRKYGFSKRTLAKSCEGVGIHYEHLPELGIASEDRRNLETQSDYDALFALYEQESLPKQNHSLGIIRTWTEKDNRVALTCFERLPQQCHRHSVAEKLERDFGKAFTPSHL